MTLLFTHVLLHKREAFFFFAFSLSYGETKERGVIEKDHMFGLTKTKYFLKQQAHIRFDTISLHAHL